MKTEDELRSARERLANVLYANGFVKEVTPQTVTKLTKEGFAIGGHIGASFSREKGLTIWNRSQRNTGKQFTLNELVELEMDLITEFNAIWGFTDFRFIEF